MGEEERRGPAAGPSGAGTGLPRGVWVALAAGLALRLWYWHDLAGQPWHGVPLVDGLSFDREALALLDGARQGAHFRPPLYPAFLAALYRLFGHSAAAVAGVQFLLGLATVVPAALLAERWFGRGAALGAAWIAAVYPLRIFFEGELLDVTVFTFLLLWGLWASWSAREQGRGLRALLGGLLLGAASLARPNLVIALPFAGIGLALAFRGRPGGGGKLWAALAIGATLAVAPVTVRNWHAEGAFIPVAANGGVNFYLGNAPGASGLTPVPPGLRWESLMQEPLREGRLTLSAQQDWWTRRAIAAIRDNPGGWVALFARKLLLVFNAAEPSNNKALGHFTAVSFPVRHYRGWYGALLCLAAAGLLAPLLDGRAPAGAPARRGTLFLALFVGGFAASVALFFVAARYRVPLVPLLAAAAAGGLLSAAGAARAREWSRLAQLAAAAAAAAVLVFPDWLGAGRERISADFQMGQVLLMRGEPDRALPALERARAADPQDPDVLNSIGAARFRLGDLEGAAAAYRAALRLGDFSEVWFNLGIVDEAAVPPRRDEAAAAYRRALAINPLEERARANLRYLEEEARPTGRPAGAP